MAYRWIPPPLGTLKLNVHGAYSAVPYPNDNNMGIGAVFRTNSGVINHVQVGILPNLSILGNQLWAVYAPMRRAFMLGYKSVIVETDNYDAYMAIRDFNPHTPPAIFDLVQQIDTLRRNATWYCSIAFVFPARNRVARYSAKLGMEVGDLLYTMDRPVGAIEELADWDLGLGVDHPDYMNVHLLANAPDPVNFDGGIMLADNAHNLGLGQENATETIIIDVEDNEDGLNGVVEQNLANINMDEALLYAHEPPLEGID